MPGSSCRTLLCCRLVLDGTGVFLLEALRNHPGDHSFLGGSGWARSGTPGEGLCFPEGTQPATTVPSPGLPHWVQPGCGSSKEAGLGWCPQLCPGIDAALRRKFQNTSVEPGQHSFSASSCPEACAHPLAWPSAVPSGPFPWVTSGSAGPEQRPTVPRAFRGQVEGRAQASPPSFLGRLLPLQAHCVPSCQPRPPSPDPKVPGRPLELVVRPPFSTDKPL